MQNTFGRPSGLRNTFYTSPEEEARAVDTANQARLNDLNAMQLGLARGMHTTPAMLADAGSVYSEPFAPDFSRGLRNWASGQYEQAQTIPQRVARFDDIRSLGDTGSYIAGKMGEMVPQVAAVTPAALTGFIAGGPAGAVAGAYGANVAMTSGEHSREMFEDPRIMASTTPEQRAIEAGKYGAMAGALDTVGDVVFGSRLLGAGKALKSGVKPALKHLVKAVPESAVTEGLPELGQDVLNQYRLRNINPERDLADASDMREAFFGGWAGGMGLTGAGRGVQVARANVPEVREWLGETAGKARERLAEALRPKDLPPEMANASDAEILAWDAQQSEASQRAAEELATEALNNPSAPQTLRERAAKFFEDVRNGVTDAWEEFSGAVQSERTYQRAQDGMSRFADSMRSRMGRGQPSGTMDAEMSADDQAIFSILRESLPADFAQRGDARQIYNLLREALVDAKPDLPWNALIDTFGSEARTVAALARMQEGLARMGEAQQDAEFRSKLANWVKVGNERDNTEHARFIAALLPRHGTVDKQTALDTINQIRQMLRRYSDMAPEQRKQFDDRMTEMFGPNSDVYLNSLIGEGEQTGIDAEEVFDDEDASLDPAISSINETDGPSIRYIGSARKRVDEGAEGSAQHGGFFNLAHPSQEVRENIQRRFAAAKKEARDQGMSVRELTPLQYAQSAGINPNIIAQELGVTVEELSDHPARMLRVEDAVPGALRGDTLDISTEELNQLAATQTRAVLFPRASVSAKVASDVEAALKLKASERFKALRNLGYPHATKVERVGGKSFVQSNLNYAGAGRFTVVMQDGRTLTMDAQRLIARQRKASEGQETGAAPEGVAELQRMFSSAVSSILSNPDVSGIRVFDAFGRRQKSVKGSVVDEFGPYFQLISTKEGTRVNLGESSRKQVRGNKGRDVQKEASALEDRVEELTREMEGETGLVSEIENQIADLEAQIDALYDKRGDEAVAANIRDLEAELDDLNAQRQARMVEAEQDLAQAEESLAEISEINEVLQGEKREASVTVDEITEEGNVAERRNPKPRGTKAQKSSRTKPGEGRVTKLKFEIKNLEEQIKTLSRATGVPAQNRRAALQQQLDAKRAELAKLDPSAAETKGEAKGEAKAEVDAEFEQTVDEVFEDAKKKSDLDEVREAMAELRDAAKRAYGRLNDIASGVYNERTSPSRDTIDALVQALREAVEAFISAAKVTGIKANKLRKLAQAKIAQAQALRKESAMHRARVNRIMKDVQSRVAERVRTKKTGDPKQPSDELLKQWLDARGGNINWLYKATAEDAIVFEELLKAVGPLGLPQNFKTFMVMGKASNFLAAIHPPSGVLIIRRDIIDNLLGKGSDLNENWMQIIYRAMVHELVHVVDSTGSQKIDGATLEKTVFASTANKRLNLGGDLHAEAQRLTERKGTRHYFAYPLNAGLDPSVVASELTAQALSAYYTNPAQLLRDSPMFYDFAKEIADGLVAKDRSRVLRALSGVREDGGQSSGGRPGADGAAGSGTATGTAKGGAKQTSQRQAGSAGSGGAPGAFGSSSYLKAAAKALDKAREFIVTAQNTLIDSDNTVLQKLGRMFSNETGSKDQKISFMSARVQKTNEYLNKLVAAIQGYEKITLNAAVKGLQNEQLAEEGSKVREVQDKVRALLDEMHDYLVESGVPVKKRKNYFPRVWDALEIQANRDEFVQDLIKDHFLSTGKTLSLASAEGIADTLIQNRGAEAVTENDYQVGYTPYMQAANKRPLDFLKSDYSKYQRSDMVEIMSAYISQASHRAEYAKRFGNDGAVIKQMMLDAYKEELSRLGDNGSWDNAVKAAEAEEAALAKKENRKPRDVGIEEIKKHLTAAKDIITKADEQIRLARRAVMAMEGTLGAQSQNKAMELLRRFTPAMIVYQNFRLLWLSLTSQFIDPLGVIVRGGTVKQAWNAYVRGLRGVIHGWKGTEFEDSMTQLARKLGVVDAANALNTMGNMYSAAYLDGKAKRVNDALFRWNGVEMFTQGVRVGAMEAAISFIQFHLGEGNRHSERYLAELGLKKGDKFDLDDPKIRDAIFRWTDGAAIRPNAALRPSWASDPHYALFFHMKQFTYAFHKVILERMITEAKHGNYNGMYAAAAAYVPVMIAADVLRGFISNGGEEPPWMRRADAGDIILRGIERAGLLGIPQLGKEAFDWGPMELAGPGAEQVYDTVANIFGENYNKAWRDALPAVNVIRDALDFK